jgi:hypothetical protein
MAGYGDDSGFEAWAEANGYEVPSSPDVAVLRQRGSAYIDGLYGPRFSGSPTGGYAQERAWPRTGAQAYDTDIGSSVIPAAVVEASYFAAYADGTKPGSLQATYTPGTTKVLTEVKGIKWEVIGDPSKPGSMVPVISAVEGLLARFLKPVGGIPHALVV